ncbi:MAG: M36 family metallopeptidase [Candidatus Wallbacteria bacterium]|nr:M36 family metallopeptidase [Candidatus Wallbacteria bacterium]
MKAIRTRLALGALALASLLVLLPGKLVAQPALALVKLKAASRAEWQVQPDASGLRARRLWGAATSPYAGKAGDAAGVFVKENAALLGVESDLSDLAPYRTKSGQGSSHVWYRRMAYGLPVEQSLLAVHFDSLGRVVMVDNEAPVVERLEPGADSLSEAVAREVAVGAAGSPRRIDTNRVMEKVLHVADGLATPAWKVVIGALDPPTSKIVLVSAIDGRVLEVRNTLYDATGQVFAPNPVVYLRNFSLSDQSDTDAAVPGAAYRTVTFDIDAAQRGVNNTFFFQLRGQFADVRQSSDDSARATSPTDVFSYTRSNPFFEEVMIYHHLTNAQLFLQRTVGITDANPGALVCYAHELSEANAFYRFSDRSLSFGDGGVDTAEDADVIVHEYGHAILDFQVPGISSVDGLAIHEGFADFFASSMSSTMTTAGGSFDGDPACVGEWFMREFPPELGEDRGDCLRRSDDKERYKRFPDNLDPEREVHRDGEIWSRFLWQIRQGFVDLGNPATPNAPLGNRRGLRLAVRANSFMTPGISFQNAAQAVLAADRTDPESFGSNTKSIVQAGIQRGLMTIQVQSITPTFMFLGTTTTIELSGDSFAGASAVALSDGTQVPSYSVLSNNLIQMTVPARETAGRFRSVVFNMGTTGTGISPTSFLRVDDHPNSPAAVLAAADRTRDTALVNSAPAAGNIEVPSAVLPSTGQTTKEVDVFRFTVLRGHTYEVRTVAGTARDTVLTVLGADGRTVLGFNDDADPVAGDLTSRLSVSAASLTTPSTTFFARVELPAGRTGTYSLSLIDTGSADDHPNTTGATRVPADRLTEGGTLSGTIDYAGDMDFFRFDGSAGAVYDIFTTLGTLKDSIVTVYDSDGVTVLGENDDTPEDFGVRSSLVSSLQVGAKATYYVRVRHADVTSSGSIGSYTLGLRRRTSSLDVRSVELPGDRVSRGQSVVVTVTVANSGLLAVSGLAAALDFRTENRGKTSDFVITPDTAGNATSLAPGVSTQLHYTVVPKAAALTGRVVLNSSATAFDGAAVVGDPASARTTAFTLQTQAILSVLSVTAVASNVSRGQSVPVTVSVANLGQATAVVSSVSPIFLLAGADRSGDYVVTPAPAEPGDNPDAIAGGQRATYRFQVDVSAAAAVGQIAIHASASGTDGNSRLAIPTDSRADTPDIWNVQTPATLGLVSLSGPGARVSTGKTQGLTLTLANSGQASMELTTVVFTVNGAGGADRTLEYSIVGRPANATRIAGGSRVALRFDLTASTAATTGPAALFVLVAGRDGNSRTPSTTTGDGLMQSFVLERVAGLSIVGVEAERSLVSQGQSTRVTVTVLNTGNAAATGATVALALRSGAVDRAADYVVTPSATNPSSVAGNARARFVFDVAVRQAAALTSVTITASATARDANSGASISALSAGVSAVWTVQRPASVSIVSLSVSPSAVQRGGQATLRLVAQNPGEASFRPGTVVITFSGAGEVNRSAQYTVVRSPQNPTELPGGATRTFDFTATASELATTGTLLVAVTLPGVDSNSGVAVSGVLAGSRRPSFRMGFLEASIVAPAASDLLFSDEPVSLISRVREDNGTTVPASGITWSADGQRLGTGSKLSAALGIGAHVVNLSAVSPAGFTSSARTFIQVLGDQPPVTLLIVSGTLRSASGTALGSGLELTVRNVTKGLTSRTTSAQGGLYSAIFSSTTSAVASLGDLLTFECRDTERLPRSVSPASSTVRNRDLRGSRKSIDLQLADLIDIRFALAPGLNLVSFPAEPLTSASAYTTQRLLTDSGAAFLARIPATGDEQSDVLLMEDARGATASALIEPHQGYLLSMPAARTVALKGTAWPASARSRLLVRGQNFVGLPAPLPAGATSQSLADATFSNAVSRTRTGAGGRGEFETWGRGAPTFALERGKGYVVVPRRTGVRVLLPGE